MGLFELLLLALVVLLFFGGSKLPALGAGLGKAVRSFKEAVKTEPPPPRAPEPKKELPPSSGEPPA